MKRLTKSIQPIANAPADYFVMRRIMRINKCFIVASVLLFSCLASSGMSFAQEPSRHNYKPPAGYVPNEETAIKIAVAVWTPIYGKDVIDEEKPYKAVLKDGVWYVSGSLPIKYTKGGVAEAEISRDDGRIIRVTHGK